MVRKLRKQSGDSDSCSSGSLSWRQHLLQWRGSRSTSLEDVSDSSSFVEKPNFRRSIRTISLHYGSDEASEISVPEEYNLRIIPLLSQQSRDSSQSSPPAELEKFSANCVGLVDTKKLDFGDMSKTALMDLAKQLDLLRIQRACSGVILRITDDSSFDLARALLPILCQRHINLFAMCDPDLKALCDIDFGLLDGIIVENACILPTGNRRAFFQAEQLRQIMGRCNEARIERPSFFIGFLDFWNTPPSASVARRAFKLAEYYGAALFHGPKSSSGSGGRLSQACPMSLSGFDFLKRSEMVELQKSWRNDTRKVDTGDALLPSDVAALPLEELHCVLPQISTLLQHYDLPESIERTIATNDGSAYYPPFKHHTQPHSDIFSISGQREQYSDLGCFPLTCEVTDEQYDSVLETQRHLQELGMLHPLEDVDMLKLTASLQNLLESSQYPEILETLLCGLASYDIRIYQGLDSGFRTSPDNPARLWGLSNWQDLPDSGYISARRIDIFVSNRAPSIAGTVLHTYLAYSGVPRAERYAEELMLEHIQNNSTTSRLPTSVLTELFEASESELLSLVHRIGDPSADTALVYAIHEKCVELLTERASKMTWSDAHSKGFLEGSLSIELLLSIRLEELAKKGAAKLPRIENLTELYRKLDERVGEALLVGDRNVLNVLGDALLKAYDPWKSWSTCEFVDVNADLVALMFFCALKKAAFEDLFVETTDRCPFITQPDQAAVFAELWVLGSQCEIYFGILPRTVGEIIYARYIDYLRKENPSPATWNGKDVFTAYSSLRPDNNNDGEEQLRLCQRIAAFVLEFGALSIFCVPAIVDVCLLTFVGRGFFLTAFMSDLDRLIASYALLTSLLIAAGITGWAGSVGGYYLYNHAYHNMNHFLVQRLSAGFVLTAVVALCGLLALSIQYSVRVGAVFVAYLFVLSIYLTLLGKYLLPSLALNSRNTNSTQVSWRRCTTKAVP